MPSNRDYRNLKKGFYCHIYNRSNRKDTIFFDDNDYRNAIKLVIYKLIFYEQDIVCYCFMPNHYHLLVKIGSPIKFSRAMQVFASVLSKRYNTKYDTVGHLFQDKFKHKIIKGRNSVRNTSAYIHLNPLDLTGATMKTVIEYPWSSIKYFDYNHPIFLANDVLKDFPSKRDYIKFLNTTAKKRKKKKTSDIDFD